MAQSLSFRESSVLGWDGDSQSHYGDDLIERIKDPNGSGLDSVTCAVPSPFARLERVKTAFENITKTSNLQPTHLKQLDNVIATQEDAKLVSQTLDIAEMVFQRSIIKGLEIVHWDFSEAKQRMFSKGNAAKRFAETLEIYLNQDQQFKTENVQIKEFELIKFNNRVIGCTSPSTLFASADIDLSFARTSLQGDRKLFETPCPLYQRGNDFQMYLYYLFAKNQLLREISWVFNEYLEKNLNIIQDVNPSWHEKLYKIWIQDQQALESYSYTLETSQNAVSIETYQNLKIASVELPMKTERRDSELLGSGFKLNSSYKSDKPVLVLPPAKPLGDYQDIRYLESNWDKNIKVPYFDSQSNLESRTLPGTVGVKAAYLTVSDLLEPNIIKLPYKTWETESRKSDFYFGDTENVESGYLLPLKPLFFQYFSVDDLKKGSEPLNMRQYDQSKPRLKFRESANEISVELYLPIQNDKQVRFQRTYFKGDEFANEVENIGQVLDLTFNIAIYPNIRVEGLKNFYKIQSIYSTIDPKFRVEDGRFNLQFFKNSQENPISIANGVKRFNTETLLTKHFSIEENFDYIQITDNRTKPSTKAILIPNWNVIQQGGVEFDFAIDFGTTNTHIEYINNHISESKPFDITEQDIQISTLLPRTEKVDYYYMDLHNAILREFVPHLIGSAATSSFSQPTTTLSFPQATAISYNELAPNQESMNVLSHVNIPFAYNKMRLHDLTTQTDLKWKPENKILAKLYFTELLFLIRNKVLLNRGNLNKTKLVTFYPSSMPPSKINEIEFNWTKLFEEYISENSENLKLLPESIAPFYFYAKRGGTAGESISIDIGGGTTDVVLFSTIDAVDKPKLITSFRFAANSIFGDGYAENNAKNHPLVRKYTKYYRNILDDKDKTLLGILEDKISRTSDSDAINAFLFSIENNPSLKQDDYHYSYMLKNDEQYRIIFLYFYSAIIYHIAQWLKQYNQPKPTNFFFSGTGAKILNIIDSSRNYKNLTDYTKKIFEKVNGESYDEPFKLKFDPIIAKEVTSKGGLTLLDSNDNQFDIRVTRNMNRVLVLPNFNDETTYAELEENEELKKNVVESVKQFNNFFISLLKEDHGFISEIFGIKSEALEKFNESSNRDLMDYLKKGNSKFNSEQGDRDKPINNSPFFYPIIYSIQELMRELETNKI